MWAGAFPGAREIALGEQPGQRPGSGGGGRTRRQQRDQDPSERGAGPAGSAPAREQVDRAGRSRSGEPEACEQRGQRDSRRTRGKPRALAGGDHQRGRTPAEDSAGRRAGALRAIRDARGRERDSRHGDPGHPDRRQPEQLRRAGARQAERGQAGERDQPRDPRDQGGMRGAHAQELECAAHRERSARERQSRAGDREQREAGRRRAGRRGQRQLGEPEQQAGAGSGDRPVAQLGAGREQVDGRPGKAHRVRGGAISGSGSPGGWRRSPDGARASAARPCGGSAGCCCGLRRCERPGRPPAARAPTASCARSGAA